MKKTKREKWISFWAGQLSLCAGQIAWTAECTKALHATAEGGKGAMRQTKKRQVSTLNKLCDMVRGNLGKLDRKKVVNIVTVEVHSRDVIDRMVKSGCASVNDFEWLLQLRFYWEAGETQRCVVKQTNTQTLYGYEYLGNPARLIVTPLTDRCYTTLTTALHLHRGGLPQGPAGTGKTETVKDLVGDVALAFACSHSPCARAHPAFAHPARHTRCSVFSAASSRASMDAAVQNRVSMRQTKQPRCSPLCRAGLCCGWRRC